MKTTKTALDKQCLVRRRWCSSCSHRWWTYQPAEQEINGYRIVWDLGEVRTIREAIPND